MKMFKRKLFKHAFSKRALPIILSVAMIFQSMPATAMAAEDAVAVEETVEDTTDEQTATEAAEPASEQDDSEAEPSEAEPTEDTETPASTEEPKEDDQVVASTEETKEDSETPVSTEETEEDSETPASTEGETKEDNETPVSTEEPSQDATVPETTEVAEESTTTEELDAEQKELTAAQIIIDTNALEEDSLNYNLNYNDGVVSGTYVPEGKLFDSLVNYVLKGSQDVISVKIDGKTNEHLNEKLAFKWRKVTGEILAELKGDTPTDAGTYRLEISLGAIDGLCNAAENVSIDFEIKQAELTVNLEDLEMPVIGSKIADFVANLKENYQLYNSENEELNKETYVKDIKVTVKDSISGTEITDLETKFEKDKDYSYSISVELTDSNYTVKDIGVRDIVLQGDITTTMEVTLPKNLVYTYGDEIKLPVAGTDYTVKIIATIDEKETEVEVPADGITATWLDADGNEIELSEGAAPSDAGTYYVLLTYTDATGRYKGCDNKLKDKKDKTSIRVTINPVSIYVKPKFEKTKDGITEYTDGKTRDDILQDVKYDLIKTVGDTTLTETEFDKKTGWGVSYNNENKTQYYEPVFELQVSKPETDPDGKVTWSSYETVNEDEKLIGGGELAKYRVVFTGKKAVYNGNRVSSEVDINNATNSAVPNFKVDDTKETLEKYAVELTITKANVEIDISKYGIADKHYKKIFDGTPVYENREEYKIASVGGKSEGLSYRWFEAQKKEQKDESGNVTAVTYERGDERFTFNYTNSEGEALYYVAPVEAGTYMLVISYKDPNHEKSAEDVEIIYEIEQQKIAAEVSTGTEGNKVTVYSGTSISDYAEKLAESITTEIKKSNSNKVNGNKLEDLVPDDMLSLWEYDEEYVLVPVIERQDNITGEWKEVVDPDTFIEGSHYRIGFGVNIFYPYLENNYQSYDIIETEDGTSWNYYLSNYVDVTVEKMGTVPLELKADEAAIGAIKEYDGMPFAIPTEAVTVYNQNTGELVSDVTVEFQLFDETIGQYVNIEKAINGGKYTLYASFDGNAVYAPLEMTQVGASNAFEITKRAISISPVLNSTIEAGQNSTKFDKIIQQIPVRDEDGDTINIPVLNISGILDTETISDKAIFTPNMYYYDGEQLFGYPAIESYDFSVKKTDGSAVPDSVLKSDIDYYVVSNVTLRDPYNRNYKVTNTKATFTPVRGKASVSKTSSYGKVPETSLKDYTEVAEGTKEIIHTIVPREGIPYVHNNVGLKDADGKDIVGNLFIFQIKAPKEFYQSGDNESYYPSMTNAFNPIFKNEIERAIKEYGGYLFTTEEQAKSSGKIVVAFRTEGEENKNPSFKVRWADGYLEEFTVDFNGAVLEANLRKAVAPKSLAFNAPLKKMVIGEKQQLDVKVTKKKLDDVICLKYEVDNTDVLSITEDTGAVVALSVGAATVKVIPCYEDEEGIKQPIEGAKAATVKISVVDVTAPKIKTVTALDISAVVTYPKLPDGYRREIYVLEDPKAKEDAFITAIEKLKNGDWKSAGFATAPIYTATESYDAKSKTSRVPISGLKAGSQYAVYVRNVSGIRTLADGSSVAVSAKGAVKSFKTTASQVQALEVRFDDEHYKYVNDVGGYTYTADVSEKKIPSITIGKFLEQAKNLSANEGDIIEYKLPIAKEDLTYYAQPKLSYIVTYNYEDYHEDKAVDSYTVKIGNRYYAPSSVAKIDKKGNVTLTGKGWVDIVVYDAVTDQYGYGTLYVTADATKMTVPKSVKVRVGELIRIEDYITYFAGKQKLTNYTPNIEIGWLETGDNDAFSISSTEYGNYITAKEAKKSTQLRITDRNVSSENDSNVVYLTINSTDISPVKNLKVTEAVDKYATVSFTYPRMNAMNAYEYGDDPDPDTYIHQLYFRIQIIDAAKNIVSDKYYSCDDLDHVSDLKKKTDTFTTYIGFDKPLVRKSSYTVSVTATYLKKEAVSKAVSKNFKTTDIPAAYQAEYGYELGHKYGEEQNFFPFSKEADSSYKNSDGGISILVNNNEEAPLNAYKALTSNNTYTLVAVPQNLEAKNRLSDTLTWKSTNTKVATVKANAGSYTATLKTLKKGVTKIELTSKVTKKLIARWTVFVNATGEASYFFGEYEPDNGSALDESVEYGDIEILTMDNPVKLVLAAGEGKIVKFVAPEYGSYNFTLSNSSCSLMRCDVKGTLQRALEDVALQKGETCYLKVVPTVGKDKTFTVTLRASGTLYETWSGIGKYNLEKKGSIAFTAPEDNYYIIKNSNDAIVYQEGLKAGQTKVVSLSKGTYTVSMRTPIVKVNEGATKDQNIEGKTTNWYVFEAPSDMSYEFGLTSTNNAVTLKLYDKITSGNGTTTSKKTLNKGDKVYIGVENKSLTAVKTDLTITPDAERGVIDVTKETSKSVSLEKAGEGKFVQYIIPEDGFYRFKTTGTVEDTAAKAAVPNLSVYYTDNTNTPMQNLIGDYYEGQFDKDEIVYVYVESPSNKTTVTIKTTKISVKGINFGENATSLSSDMSYYKFTADKDGDYSFKAVVTPRTGENAITPNATVNSYKGKEFNIASFSNNLSYRGLKKGDIIYLQVFTDDTENKQDNAKITVSRVEATPFTDTWSGKLAADSEKWLQFKATEDTIYYFYQKTTQTQAGKGNVSVEKYQQLNGNGSNIEQDNFSVGCKAGESFYLKLSVTGGEVTYSINAVPVQPGKVPPTEFKIPAKSEIWFVYTAPVKARYSVNLTGNDAKSCTISKGTSILSNMISIGIASEVSLDAGETVYYKVENRTEAEKTVKLTIEPIKTTALNLKDKPNDTVKLTDGSFKWYSFTAETAGRYSFNTTAKAAEGQVASANMTYFADANGEKKIESENNPEQAVLVKANETIYIRVGLTGADADVTTTVKAIKPASLTAKVGTPITIEKKDLAEGSYEWYDIKDEGTYTINLSDATGAYTAKSVRNNDSFEPVYFPVTVTLGENDTYTLAIKADAAKLGYKVTSTVRDVKELTLTKSVDGKLKTGEDLYVSFKVPENGRYAISLEGLKDDVSSTITYTGGSYDYCYGNGENYSTFVSSINEKITFKVNVTSETSVGFKVKAEKVSAADITTTGTATMKASETPAGYMKWYSYTAAEDGKYIVKASDAKAILYADYGNDLSGEFERYRQMKEVTMEKGVTYYYAMYYGAKPAADVTFSVKKATANKLDKEYTVKVAGLVSDEKTYISYTAPEDGRYLFTCTEQTVSTQIYDSVDDMSIKDSLSFNTDRPMEAGEEIVFAVSTNVVPKTDYKITVSKVVPAVLEASKEVKKDLAPSETLWVSFKASETAKYKFEMTNVDETYVYEDLMKDAHTRLSNGQFYSVDNGKTIYLKLTPNSSAANDSGKVAVSIKASVDTKMEMLKEAKNEVKDIAANGDKWAYFTAETAGFYQFAVTGNCSVYVYTNADGSYDRFMTDGNSYNRGLGKGDSLYFRIQNNGESVDTEKITITKETEVKELVVGKEDIVVTTDENNYNYAWYVFTAPEEGMYNIITSDNDASVRWYDNLNSGYVSSDDILKKGDVRYIEIGTSDPNCTITCAKVSEQTVTLDTPLNLTMQKGESVLVNWIAENNGYYRIRFTANNEVSYEEYYFDTYGKGESWSWPVYVNIDDESNLLISTHKDDTEVTVSVEPLSVQYMYDQMSTNFTIPHSGDAVLIKWYPYSSGNYQIDARTNKQVHYIEYGSNLDYIIDVEGIEGYNYSTSWLVEQYQDRYLYVEALSDNTDVSFTVSKEIRKLEVGRSYHSILSCGESEIFSFTAEKDGTYIFYSQGSSDLSVGINVHGGNTKSADVYSSGNDNNFCIAQYFDAGEQAEITVTKNSYDSNDFWVYTHMLQAQIEEDINQEAPFSKTVDLEDNQEYWFLFTIAESGYYEFSTDSSSCMKLYNYDTMEVLGEKEDPYGNSTIKAGLTEGTTVLLRTWYYYHNAGTYNITVQQGALSSDKYFEKLVHTDVNVETPVWIDGDYHQQAEISYNYNDNNYKVSGMKLKFSVPDSYNDLHLALYLGSDTEPVAEGNNELEYAVESENFNSIKLIVWRDAYKEFSTDVYCSVEEFEYETTLDSSKSLYIPQNGSATVIYPAVSKAGKYVFYSTDNVSATVYKNDTELTLDNESLFDTGFQYTLDLAENDIIKFIFNTDDGESRSISLYGYEVTEDLASAELPTTNKPVAVSKEHAIKIITFTNNSKGTYTFNMVQSEDYPNCEFELTVGGKTYTDWNIATEEVELKQNAEVILKLWNADRYGMASATLEVTYQASATEPTEPETPDQGGDSDGSGDSDNSGNTDSSGETTE